MDHDSGEPVVGVLAEAKPAEKMNNASIQHDPAFVFVAQFIRKQWPRIEEQITLYGFIPWFLWWGEIMTENHCLGHPVLRQNHIVDVAQTEGCHFIIQFI